MKDVDASATQLRRLESEVDAELDRVGSSQDPGGMLDPEVEDYETRLHSLRDAVVALEAYEEGLDQA